MFTVSLCTGCASGGVDQPESVITGVTGRTSTQICTDLAVTHRAWSIGVPMAVCGVILGIRTGGGTSSVGLDEVCRAAFIAVRRIAVNAVALRASGTVGG